MELGIEIGTETEKPLKFGEISRTADIRWLYDMKEVIYDQKWLMSQKNLELYYMYRDLAKNKADYNIIKQNNLRYDITVIPPKLLGFEFIKTAGHYHPIISESDLSYPEVYQVLKGKATYLLQKRSKLDEKSIEDFIVIKAEKGDYIIIPPNYGHVTINESTEILTMANWVCRDFSSEYDLIKKMKGMAYFLTPKEFGTPFHSLKLFSKKKVLGSCDCEAVATSGNVFVQNLEYKNVPKIRELKPTNFSEYGFEKGVDMYNLINNITKLKFLTNPKGFLALFSKILTS